MKYRVSIRVAMGMVNWIAIVLVSVVLAGTVFRAVQNDMAAGLAASLGRVPMPPWTPPAAALLSYAVLLCTGWFLQRYPMTAKTSILAGCVEIAAALAVIFALHMAYNSILLVVLIDMVEVLKGRTRSAILISGIALYVLTSMNVVRDWLGIIPFQNYLSYYNALTAGFIRDVLMLITSLNLVGFLTSMVLLLTQKTAENERINHLNDQLTAMNEQLKAYAEESVRMAETSERNRLAREIHDTLGHALTGIASASDACGLMLDVSPEAAKKLLLDIGDTARQGITDVRRSVSALRPDALEHKALEEALRSMTERITRTTEAEVELHLPPEKLVLSADEEDAVYRIVQECITNAIRHGKASRISIELTLENRNLSVYIRDNGTGMPEGCSEGFGLIHMRERLNLLNGTLDYNGKGGFSLHAVIPVRENGTGGLAE